MIDQPRYAAWVQLSPRAAQFEKFMTPAIQGLGKIDAVLTAKDAAYLGLSQGRRESFEKSIELTERFTEAYLWVLGAYEIIRTMDQRVRENPQLVNESISHSIREAKHRFERVRIPLAKYEAARRHSDTDTSFAFPALDPQYGIAWRVADNVFVTRRELSECFMALLRAV